MAKTTPTCRGQAKAMAMIAAMTTMYISERPCRMVSPFCARQRIGDTIANAVHAVSTRITSAKRRSSTGAGAYQISAAIVSAPAGLGNPTK